MKTYGEYLASIFPDFKVQKISVDAGFTCPNRDGSIAYGGCSYCRNDSFSPSYCNANESIAKQLSDGKTFFGKKYPDMKYLAYFQRYTGTYGHPTIQLEKFYREALDVEDVVGIVIGTRPDCISDQTLDLLGEINRSYPVFMEIGAETSHDVTLKAINRNHTWNDVEDAVSRLGKRGIRCGMHLICGLPGEDEEMILETVEKSSRLPLDTLKFHQLQILRDTPLFMQWKNKEVKIREFSVEEYMSLCLKICNIVPENIVIERFLSQSPPEMVAFPKWGMKNYEFMNKLTALIKNKR